jgi:hypothetical protein
LFASKGDIDLFVTAVRHYTGFYYSGHEILNTNY